MVHGVTQISKRLLSDVTSTGLGDAHDLENVYRKFDCTVSWSGTAPDDVSVKLHGALFDGLFVEMADKRITSSVHTFTVITQGAQWVKGEYSDKTGGGGDTQVRFDVTAGGIS